MGSSSLLTLAHTDKSRVFDAYTAHYLATSGQRYRSDDHQFAIYLDEYHTALDPVLESTEPGTEMITELSVPRALFEPFLATLAGELRARRADLIYGTVRLIERDDVTFLPWAREDQVCVVLNLHVPHTPAGMAEAATTFRGLIDVALRFGGTYYLTYHRYAAAEQVLAATRDSSTSCGRSDCGIPTSASPATGTATIGSCSPGMTGADDASREVASCGSRLGDHLLR